ncbi:hypothetical protein DFQ30_006347 [Apophysomyces sp. BC1015]|nr:hypothetical protein DFQ30_006347 [Apophysomyces sp. BC1015]
MGHQLAQETTNDYYPQDQARYGGGPVEDNGYYNGRDRRRRSRDRYRDHDRDRHDRSSRRSRRGRSRDRRERSRERHSYSRSNRDDREGDNRRTRRRSPSPRPSRSSSRRRDDTVVPLHKRERKLQNWDMAPPGMDTMSAEQVKQTGLFPLPGQVVGTRAPQSFAAPGTYAAMGIASDGSRVRLTQGAAGPVALNATVARQARRIYVGQIPFGIDEKEMTDFFNETMEKMNLASGPSVLAVQINHDKNYAFVEFHDPDQATAAMAFDGITFQAQTLKIRRPKDYLPAGDDASMVHVPGVISTIVPDTPHKIFVGGLPMYLNEEQVMELLQSFGELRAFHLVKESNGQSKGFAFCEYAEPTVTDLACEGLNDMQLGDRKLVVQRASQGAKHPVGIPGDVPAVFPFIPVGGVKEEEATRVLALMNMVTPEELENDEEYQDIWDDIEEECGKFGTVMDLKIPRPVSGQIISGLGKIFVRFENQEQAMAALKALAGRKFADRTVLSTFVDEDQYLAENY